VGILIILKSIDLNIIFLKHGKLGQLYKMLRIKMKYLKRFLYNMTNFLTFLVNGCRIFTKHNAPINRVDRFEE
jgi:hypothetical protein